NVENPRQPFGMAAARVDVGPVYGALNNGVAMGRDVVQHGLIPRFDPHGGDPRRGEEKGEGGAISLSRTWHFGARRDSCAAPVRESRMNRRIGPPRPCAPVEWAGAAAALARGSAIAFWIWGAVGLMQAGLVWFLATPEQAAMRGTTAGFAVFFAATAFLL